MAIFSGKVISATFSDFPTNTIIEVLYKEEDGVTSYVLEVDFTQNDFNDLLQDITLEEIEEATQTIVKAEADIFNRAVNEEIERRSSEEIERRWAKESKKIKEAYNQLDEYAEDQKLKKLTEVEQDREDALKTLQEKYNSIPSSNNITSENFEESIFNHIIEKNEDRDFIFSLKINVLDHPKVLKSKDKTLKTNIRKSKSALELLGHISEIIKDEVCD